MSDKSKKTSPKVRPASSIDNGDAPTRKLTKRNSGFKAFGYTSLINTKNVKKSVKEHSKYIHAVTESIQIKKYPASKALEQHLNIINNNAKDGDGYKVNTDLFKTLIQCFRGNEINEIKDIHIPELSKLWYITVKFAMEYAFKQHTTISNNIKTRIKPEDVEKPYIQGKKTDISDYIKKDNDNNSDKSNDSFDYESDVETIMLGESSSFQEKLLRIFHYIILKNEIEAESNRRGKETKDIPIVQTIIEGNMYKEWILLSEEKMKDDSNEKLKDDYCPKFVLSWVIKLIIRATTDNKSIDSTKTLWNNISKLFKKEVKSIFCYKNFENKNAAERDEKNSYFIEKWFDKQNGVDEQNDINICKFMLAKFPEFVNPTVMIKSKEKWNLIMMKCLASYFYKHSNNNISKNDEMFHGQVGKYLFFHHAIIVVFKTAIFDITSKKMYKYISMTDKFGVILLWPLNRFVENITESNMKMLYSLMGVGVDTNTRCPIFNVHDYHYLKILYNFLATLWREEYVGTHYIDAISTELKDIVVNHLKKRIKKLNAFLKSGKIKHHTVLGPNDDERKPDEEIKFLGTNDEEKKLDTDIKVLIGYNDLNIPLDIIRKILASGTFPTLLACTWNLVIKLSFNDDREQILQRYAYLETCFRLGTNNSTKTNVWGIFQNINKKSLYAVMSNPNDLPALFYKNSKWKPGHQGIEVTIESIITILLSKCHIDTSENSKEIRKDMEHLFNFVISENEMKSNEHNNNNNDNNNDNNNNNAPCIDSFLFIK